ncbi:MAG: DUF2341 domain-containing protein [Actinomycetota bacterium]|nr:DUF2341 domain-containing protein [Actinomycetota bacterium]
MLKRIDLLAAKLNKAVNYFIKAKKVLSRRPIVISAMAIVIFNFLIFPGFGGGPAEAELLGWHNRDWQYRKEIIIDRTKVKSEFSDFALAIALNDADLKGWANGGHVGQTDGGDILFCDATGEKLDHEIETYDPKDGRLVAWVKLKTISPIIDTKIHLYYGNPKCEDQSSIKSIFEPSLKMVQHMGARNGFLLDSTASSNSAKSASSGPKDIIGQTGGAQEFDGANDYLDFGNKTSLGWVENSFMVNEGGIVEPFENGASWSPTGKGAIQTIDKINFKEGAASLKLTSRDGSHVYSSKRIDVNLSSADNFMFWVYISERSKLSSISISFTSTKNWSKDLTASVTSTSLKSGWNRVILRRSDFTTSTGESWSNRMVSMRVRLRGAPSGSVSANFDDFRYNQKGRAKAIISFDDGYDDVKNEAFPIMEANGQKGVAFITSDYIDTVDHLTKADLLAMRDSGWDISNHTRSHQQLTKLSWAQMDDEINGCYDWLANNGFEASAKFFAYPYGLYNDRVIEKVKERHKLARSVIAGDSQAHLLLGGGIDHLIKALNVTNKVKVATVKKSIDEAIAKGSPLIIFLHQIVDDKADKSTEYLTQDFKEVSDYLKARSKDIDVITFSDYYERLHADQQLSFELYLKPAPSSGYASVLEKYHPAYDKCTYRIAARGGGAYAARVATHNGSVLCDFGLLPTDRYSHLVMTYDGVSLKTYRDSQLVDEKTLTGSLLKNSYPLYVAKRGKTYWKGIIDEVRVYNRALSAQEIATRHNNLGLQDDFYSILEEERL